MHFLDRNTVTVPECLVSPPAGRVYKDLDGREKAQIREALLDLQRRRCAYCERRTVDHQSYDGHIEHFHDQSGHTGHTLAWTNLLWSCNDERTCGKHKDKCRRHEGEQRRLVDGALINPSAEDPEEYLIFVSDGTVAPRSALDADGVRRADETIRAFQLKSALLTRSRQDAIRPYLSAIGTFLNFGPELLEGYVRRELQQTDDAPFATAIKHFLTSVLP